WTKWNNAFQITFPTLCNNTGTISPSERRLNVHILMGRRPANHLHFYLKTLD
ncbi:hypothetical protein HHI36_007189, partial [Cryptolaemus montrouzieri]